MVLDQSRFGGIPRFRERDELAIPRKALGLPAGKALLPLSFDFKWADNLQRPGDPMDFYLSGDVAPDTRFKFRYSAR